MSVSIPGSVSGNIISEYAATNITISRNMVQDANGILKGVFSGNISYEKKTYVIDSDGNKVGLVVKQDNQMMSPMDNTSIGNIYLDATTFAQYFSKTAKDGDVLGELVANLADELIRADLVRRNILNS